MRHLRSVVAAVVADENLPPVDRSKKVADFEQLMVKAEKRLHFNENKLNGDPLGLVVNPPEAVSKTNKGSSKKKKGWLKSRLRGKSKRQHENVAPTVNPTPVVAKDRKMRLGGALETLEEEEERGDVEESRGNDSNPAGGSKRVGGPSDRVKPKAGVRNEQALVTTKEELEEQVEKVEKGEEKEVGKKVEGVNEVGDDDTAGTATDSIMQMRMMNSEEYTASVGSVRSLGTFEKDFIKNIIAEQQVQEEVSVSTFEQDFMAREAARGGNIALPTQVFTTGDSALNENEDDLTTDWTVLSETTFEQDARNASTPKCTLPMQITTSSNRIGANEEEANDDDITIDDILSETTFEADQRQRAQAREEAAVTQAGSDPSTMAILNQFVNNHLREVHSDETKGTVSTYEKDAQALKFLAEKIGRTPSTKSKARSVAEDIVENGTEISTNTFEEDYKAREMMMKGVASDGTRGGGGIGMASHHASNAFVPKGPAMARFPSENSTSTFEKDMNVRRPRKPQLSKVVEASHSRMSGATMLSPSSTAAMAQHQMRPLSLQVMSPPQQVGLRPAPDPSPMSVPSVYGPSFGASPIESPPSQSAFENDTVRSSRKTGTASSRSGHIHYGNRPSPGLGLGSISAGTASLGGFERDARASMKNVGTVYPMNHISNAGAGHGGGPASSVASAYDGGALAEPGGAASAIGLSVAAQRELTAQVDAKRAAAALPKISPLVMELSPNAIDKGVKLHNREGSLWSKFMCWTGS